MTKRKTVVEKVALGDDATFEDIISITLAQWQCAPILEHGHFDNLKFESPKFRVWTSRMTSADYNGNSNAYSDERMTVEKLIDGRWKRLDVYGRVKF